MPLYHTITAAEILAKLITVDGAGSGLDADLLDGISSAGFDTAGAAAAAQAASQPLDADLTTIAGLTATTDNFIQSKSSAWASRTVAQVKTDLALVEVVQFPMNITISAGATVVCIGSANTAVGTIPGRAMHIKRIQVTGNCIAQTNSAVLKVTIWKNAIPIQSDTTNNGMTATSGTLAATTGFSFESSTPQNSKDAFNGSTDFYTVGAWCSGGTMTCSGAWHIRLEFQLD